ncbi:7822_t:CDS:2, partial [Gigaspora rosea]
VECKIKEYFPNGMFENGWIELESNICNNEKGESKINLDVWPYEILVPGLYD